jgi:hypothetical protein
MSSYVGDFRIGKTIRKMWNSNAVAGESITRATNGTISVYKDGGTTQSTTGVTDTEDFDGLTGVHLVAIDTSADGTFYSAGSDFEVVLSGATIDGKSINATLFSFSLENRSALMPTTDGRKLDVSAGGEAGVDWANVGGATTTVNLSGTTIKDATDVQTKLGTPAGASVSADIADIEGKVDDLESRLGTPSDLGSGATIAANLVDIEAETDDIGAAGAGLTAVPWNSAWDAEVQSEVDDALVAHRLDELLNADSDIDGAAPPTVGSVFHELMSKSAGSFTFDQTTDSLEAIRDRGDAAWITATGFSTHTAADVWAVGTRTITGLTAAALADFFDTDSGTTYASAVAGSVVKEIADNAGGSGLTLADIADAVWDEAITGHLTAGSTGAALNAAGSAGDPWSTPLPGAYGAGTAGKIIGDFIDVAISSRSSHAAADVWSVATRVLTAGTNIVLAKGTGITGFNDVSAAQVNAEVDTALADIKLDKLISASVIGADVADNSIVARIVSKASTADWDTFVHTTDSLEAIRDRGDAAWLTATGFSTHTAADVWAVGTRVLTAGTNIVLAKGTGVTGFNDLDAAGVRSAVGLAAATLDTQLGDLPTNSELATALAAADDAVLAAIAALNNLSAAQVNTEVVDALNVDTYAEPGQGAPAATTSLAAKINYLYKAWRNQKRQSATAFELYNDAGTVVDQKATTLESGGITTVNELVSGP